MRRSFVQQRCQASCRDSTDEDVPAKVRESCGRMYSGGMIRSIDQRTKKKSDCENTVGWIVFLDVSKNLLASARYQTTNGQNPNIINEDGSGTTARLTDRA